MHKIACIEAGGTKFVCALGHSDGHIEHRTSIPTTTPDETMAKVIEYFQQYADEFKSIAVGSFGPIITDPKHHDFGMITSSPKQAWQGYNMVQILKKEFSMPVYLDTDVNAAAAGEFMWGAAKGLDSCLYITVGTGVGAGAVVGGKTLQGFSHPEMGHILVRRHPDDLDFSGACPFHNDCLEGLVSGPALAKRLGQSGEDIADDDPSWPIVANYLAQALMNYILILSPHKIIMGGGVMQQSHLLPMIRTEVQELLNNYMTDDLILTDIDNYIVAPKLGNNSGAKGVIAMTMLG